MKNYYYVFWADVLHRARASNPEGGNWKTFSLFFISFIQGLNLFIFFIWLNYFGIDIPLIRVNVFELGAIDKVLSFLIEFISLPLIINYLFVFQNKRYKYVLENYPLGKKKNSANYSMIILVGAFISIILYATILN